MSKFGRLRLGLQNGLVGRTSRLPKSTSQKLGVALDSSVERFALRVGRFDRPVVVDGDSFRRPDAAPAANDAAADDNGVAERHIQAGVAGAVQHGVVVNFAVPISDSVLVVVWQE